MTRDELDEAGPLRTVCAFPGAVSALPWLHRLQSAVKFSKSGKHSFLPSSFNPGVFFCKARACKAILAANEKWIPSSLLASELHSFHMGERSVKNPHFPRRGGSAALLSCSLKPSLPSLGGFTEGRGAQRGKHTNTSHTRSQQHTATRPHRVPLGKCLSLSGPPSNEDGARCLLHTHRRRQAHTTHSLLARLITLDAR